MLEKGVTKARDQFDFSGAVRISFRFLVESFGFAVVTDETTYLRFESDTVFVNIYHGRASYEVGVEIGELKRANNLPERSFTLGEIIAMTDYEKGSNFHFYQAATPELVQKFVSETAEIVKIYSRSALIGDKSFFEGLGKVRSRISREYLKSMEMGRVREEAEVAWRQKNYEHVIELYDDVKDDLTASEIKKLEYAKRKLTDTND
jgi:hypothetical protein